MINEANIDYMAHLVHDVGGLQFLYQEALVIKRVVPRLVFCLIKLH
jgi:hypothetical protein